MCLEDFQLGNNIRAISKVVSIPSADTVLLAPDPARVGVWLSNAANDRVFVAIDQTPSSTTGFPLERTMEPVYFTMARHGDVTTREFRAIAQGATVNVFVIEFFLPQKAFQRPLESIVKDVTWENTSHRSNERTSHGSRQRQR